MKPFYLSIISLLFCVTICKSQNDERIYHFMNAELPSLEFGKSNWGIFLEKKIVPINSIFCQYLLNSHLTNTPQKIKQEFYEKCKLIDTGWQQQFNWQQPLLNNFIVVNGTRNNISYSASSLHQKNKILKAPYWIKEWNRTKINDRLVNYSSIPIFSNSGEYVLLLRGQHVASEGGWDTIYIYYKTDTGWVIADTIIVSQL